MSSFKFATNFAARLTADFSAGATSFTLSSVPDDLPAGRYSFRFGTNQFTSEWLSASYPGHGSTFTNAERISEGGNAPRAWVATTAVSNVLTGEAFNSIGRAAQAPFTTRAHPELYVRPPALRAYIASNFT